MEVLALTVGGWFAAASIKILLDKLSSDALKKWELESGLEDDLRTLEETLLKVKAVIDAAEEKQVKPESSLVELLRKLRDVAYDAEDLLDEFEYKGLGKIAEASYPLPSKGKRIKDATSRVSCYLHSKLNNTIGCCCTCQSGCMRGSTSKTPTADEIKKIVGRLESIYTGVREIVGLLKNNGSKHHVTSKKRETTLTLKKGKLYGRDEVRDKIIKKLLDSVDESSSVVDNVSVIPIIGIGGMGKTTLAQHVCNDKTVVEHFNRVWVYVSQIFDELKITRDIIRQLPGDRPHDLESMSLQSLQQQLMKVLKGKRFILVLDDVWSDEWTRILTPLECGEKGSYVVVTCREEKDLGAMGKENKILLGDLEREACRSLFIERAFHGINSNDSDYGMLKQIGNQIAEKLTGSPLEAEVVGGMLNRDVDKDKWNNILENGIWKKLGSNDNHINEVLRLSYDRLTPPLQQCFAYCSVFPKGYDFDKNDLVWKWIALGFIPKESNTRMEDTGRSYFDDLLNNSFFNSPYRKEGYVMHDLMNDLSMSVSKDECFRIEGNVGLPEIPLSVRHLSLRTKHLAKLTRCRLEKLRSFLLLGDHYEFHFNHALLLDTVKKLKHVRVLVLLDVKDLFPPKIEINKEQMNGLLIAIGELIHLRYLDSRIGNIDAFPESIWKLYHLQVLDLYGTRQIDVQKGLKNDLISLRHIVPKDLIDFSKMAKIGHLTSLQELAFKVQKKSGHEISLLKDMTELEVLKIRNLENVEVKGEGLTQAKLNEKKYLAELSLGWGSEREPMFEMEGFLLEGLHPHPNIKSLHIEGYGGSKSPTWIQGLSNLKLLSLESCGQWEVLPPIGQLGSLKVLKIVDCPELKLLPTLPLSVTELKIERTGLIALPRVAESSNNNDNSASLSSSSSSPSSSLTRLHVGGCRNLNSLGESLLQQHHLTALENLHIRDCPELTSLGGLQSLIFLKNLKIEDCPKLTVNLPEEDESLPSSLQQLHIDNGGDLDKLLLRSLQNFASLSQLTIVSCPQITLLPSVVVMCKLLSLQELVIDRCEQLISFGGLHAVVSLKNLRIEDCPNLTVNLPEEESQLPSSLEELYIKNGGDLDKLLPRYLQNLTSLYRLNIVSCPQITSLPSVEVTCQLLSLEELVIDQCEQLISFGGLHAVVSLRKLRIGNCTRLTARSPLPSSLVNLQIRDCGELDEWLPRYLENLTSLSSLEISVSEQITSLPKATQLHHLIALKKLSIWGCKQLKSLEGLKVLISLEELKLTGCPKITAASFPLAEKEGLSCLQRLTISDISLLTAPLLRKTLTSLRELVVQECLQRTSFADEEEEVFRDLTSVQKLSFIYCQTLRSLPKVLQSISSLKELEIWNCHQLKSLPDNGLPTSLTKLRIWNCRMLKDRCQVGGADWPKIAHVTTVSLH